MTEENKEQNITQMNHDENDFDPVLKELEDFINENTKPENEESDSEGNGAENKEKDSKFLQGVFCGVILTLLCMTAAVWGLYFKARHDSKTKTISGDTSVAEEETEQTLDLDMNSVVSKVQEIESYINGAFIGEIDSEQVEEDLYAGMLFGLNDQYSYYYSADNMDSLQESTSGEYVGIGVTLSQDLETMTITVEECAEGTPAEKAGIQAGDVLMALNGTDITDWALNDLVSTIKNDTSGEIALTIDRDGKEIEASMTLENIEVQTVSSRMLEGKIGYIRITEFDSITTTQFSEALETLENEGMEKLIIDLRDNPGGVLQVAVDMLDQILPEGLLVYTENKEGSRTEYYSDGEDWLEMPLAVLINQDSASASEIFAGAVKDFGAGTLVGTTTYGKGVVQRVYTLSDGSGIKLTIAKYYTPNGNDINEKGIDPDVEAELSDELKEKTELTDEEDTQLQKAIEVLSEEDKETNEETNAETNEEEKIAEK